MDHEAYLKLMHRDKKLKLEHLHEEHRVAIAVYDTKREMLIGEIDSIEKQLHPKDKQ